MKRIRRIILVLLISAPLQLYADEKAKQVDIVNIVCDQRSGQVMLKYIQSNDDFFSQPILPKSCKLNNSIYKVTGQRGPYSEERCGAEPPVSIVLSRNGIPVISDASFGGNCFGAPSVAEVKITEQNKRISAIQVCVYKEYESPVAEGDEFEPICKSYLGGSEIEKVLPISQRTLNSDSLR